MGSCEQALIRGFPNGETHLQRTVISWQSGARPAGKADWQNCHPVTVCNYEDIWFLNT